MPKSLLNRRQPHSIEEFRKSARQRFNDGLSLTVAGRRTGAIYLWGYTAEMTLKAAYFSVIGLQDTEAISWGNHLLPAVERGRSLGIAWPKHGQGHNLQAWSQLLIAERALQADTVYSPIFSRDLQRCGQRPHRLWRETLRYAKNQAYPYEMCQAREATEWLLVHSRLL